MTFRDYLPQRHRVAPYWIASMNASVSKNDTRDVQRTPFGCLPRLKLEMPKDWNVHCYVSFLRY